MRRWGLAVLGLALGASAWASGLSQRFCDGDASRLSTADQDRLLRFAAVVREELGRSSAPVALIGRAGLNLARWGVRYSHAGLALSGHPEAPWTVRQLYYACGEGRPRVFDQGVAGFVFGTNDAERGFVSLLFIDGEAGERLQAQALDREQALRVLHPRYSANAHPFSTQFQNCNQWVAELMALAWGSLDPLEPPREAAQRWLQASGFQPQAVSAGSRAWLWVARAFVPWMHFSDHPKTDWAQAQVRTTLPADVAAWVQQRQPEAPRVELCHTRTQVVVRRDGPPLSEACEAQDGDRVVPL